MGAFGAAAIGAVVVGFVGKVAAGDQDNTPVQPGGGAADGLAEGKNIVGGQVGAGDGDEADGRGLGGEIVEGNQDAVVE